MNATDLRRSQKYRLRTAFPDPFLDGVLPCQVQFIAGRSQDGAVFLAQAAKDRPAHHATMARNPNPLPSPVIHSTALRRAHPPSLQRPSIPESAMLCPQVGDGIVVQPKELAPLQFQPPIPPTSPLVPQNASFESRAKDAAKHTRSEQAMEGE